MLGLNVHTPVASHPVHVWHDGGTHGLAQQLPAAPIPVSAPHVAPDWHSRQLAAMHVAATVPAVVLHASPVAIWLRQVPAPLQ
jgi:hypothetical protein